jgi:alkaline phosphatase D
MASLRPPGLGPLVGATTDTSCRIWIRASDPADNGVNLDEDRRTVGVIGLVSKTNVIGRAWYFRLQREFDRTGTFVLGKDVQLGYYAQDFLDQNKPAPKPEDLPLKVQAVTLAPDTEYTVRCGTLTIDDPTPNAANLPDYDLIKRLPDIDKIKNELFGALFRPEQCEATFRTFPASAPDKVDDTMSFLLGSCRYPGLLWKIKEADRIFGPMQAHFQDGALGKAARYTMMCGDQIYADMLNRMIPLLRADTFEEFQERYLTAYGAPNLRQLLRSSTTYMILDDHEIEDNWTQDRIKDPGKHLTFNIAIGAYQSYQWSHSPRTFGRLFYYTFECGGYPTFVLDTRTQRFKDDQVGLRDNHMLGRPSLDEVNHPGQLQRLLDWLSEQQTKRKNVPKFIVTSSVFVPNDMGERIAPIAEPVMADGMAPADDSKDPNNMLFGKFWNRDRRDDSDSWPAYPNTRLKLLQHIVKNKIQNVVFLAGDIHCSNTATIEFDGNDAKDLKAFSVTSSAFYWPFPFADGDPNNYVHNSRDPEQSDPFPIDKTDAVMHYKSFGYTQEDNFTRLDIDKAKGTLTVRAFDRDGKPVLIGPDDKKTPIVNTLQLAKWS